MNHWSTKRKASLGIHAAVVLVPFGFSTVSAFLFWKALFNDPWLAAPMVAVIDALALLGLVLYVVRIASPFVVLRHALPFISIVPLGLNLYQLLAHNGAAVAGAVTILVTSIMVAVAWKCFTTIERLFIDPIEAAREKAREQVRVLTISMAQLREIESAADDFALERLQYRMPAMTVAMEVPESNPIGFDSATSVQPLSKTAQVKQIASEKRVSESTVWRWVKQGTLSLDGKE